VDVRGIAGQEDATSPVAGCLPVVQPEDGHPGRVAEAHGPGGGDVGDGLEVLQRSRRRFRRGSP